MSTLQELREALKEPLTHYNRTTAAFRAHLEARGPLHKATAEALALVGSRPLAGTLFDYTMAKGRLDDHDVALAALDATRRAAGDAYMAALKRYDAARA